MKQVFLSGTGISVQLRIGLTRSFDDRYHSYHGYSLFLDGVMDGVECRSSVGVDQGPTRSTSSAVFRLMGQTVI